MKFFGVCPFTSKVGTPSDWGGSPNAVTPLSAIPSRGLGVVSLTIARLSPPPTNALIEGSLIAVSSLPYMRLIKPTAYSIICCAPNEPTALNSIDDPGADAFIACATGLTGQTVPSPMAWFRFGNPAAVTSQAVLTLNALTLSTACDLVPATHLVRPP